MRKFILTSIFLISCLFCYSQTRYKGEKRIHPKTAETIWKGWTPDDIYIKFSADKSACWRTDASGNKLEDGIWYGEVNYYRRTISNNNLIEYKSDNGGGNIYYFRFSPNYSRLNYISPNYVDVYNKSQGYNSNRVY